MAVQIDIEVKDLKQLRRMFSRRPKIVTKWLNKAIEASLFEIEKQATDNNFQFKTSRSMRTGLLQRSFKFNIVTRDLYGSIGPKTQYAKFVHDGTRYLRPNKFMPRIARASQKHIQKHFNDALEAITEEMVQ